MVECVIVSKEGLNFVHKSGFLTDCCNNANDSLCPLPQWPRGAGVQYRPRERCAGWRHLKFRNVLRRRGCQFISDGHFIVHDRATSAVGFSQNGSNIAIGLARVVGQGIGFDKPVFQPQINVGPALKEVNQQGA